MNMQTETNDMDQFEKSIEAMAKNMRRQILPTPVERVVDFVKEHKVEIIVVTAVAVATYFYIRHASSTGDWMLEQAPIELPPLE